MAKFDAIHFPKLPEVFTDDALRAHGYTGCSVSVFDHVLTEEEASDCKLFMYRQAIENGLKETYLEQERRFLSFYRDLFAGGVIRRTQIEMGIYVGIVSHQHWDRRLKRDVSRSLRERGHLDAYVPSRKLRVRGGWDRTDSLLFEDGAAQSDVERLVAAHGLFVL